MSASRRRANEGCGADLDLHLALLEIALEWQLPPGFKGMAQRFLPGGENPRATCTSCGKKGADGEPSLCESCFWQEWIWDPGCPEYGWVQRQVRKDRDAVLQRR